MSVRDVVQAAAGALGGAGELAAAIDFDGTSDHLSRASDLTGNSDGKTFTFSVWVWHGDQGAILRSQVAGTQYSGIRIYTEADGRVTFDAFNTSNSTILRCEPSAYIPPTYTWAHYLLSVDLNSTFNRYLYINDVLQPDSVFQVYSNQNINFTNSKWLIGCEDISNTNSRFYQGRLSNLYLDYTYRSLAVTNNRRLFITEDLKPADGQASLNPILYLPLDDPEDIGYNAGTGGDFTVNGVMARSGRGPNQDNCVASYFDGSNDNLYRAGNYGADSKTLTISFCYSSIGANTQLFNSEIASGDDNIYVTTLNATGGLQIGTLLYNASNYAVIVTIPSTVLVHSSTYAISVSFDTSDTSKRHVFINGVDKTTSVTWNNYNLNSFVGFSTTSRTRLGAGWSSGSNSFFWGNLGEFYLSKDYTNLASNNPFWDSNLNKPIPIRKVLENTGNTPLIAMPIEGNNAGLNLGTSGNFTVNSGPYIGARGASEAITRSVEIQGSRGDEQNKLYLQVGSNGGLGGTKLTVVHFFKSNTDGETGHLWISPYSGSYYYAFLKSNVGNGGSQRWTLALYNWFLTDGTYGTFPFSTNWNVVMFSADSQDASKGRLYFQQGNNTKLVSSFTAPYSLGDLNRWAVFQDQGSANTGLVYATNDYIDFGQESNRLLFVDALGYPTDIVKKNEDGLIPSAKILLPFDDPTNFGKNLGTLGDFTTAGTPKSGKDFVRP